MSKPIHVNHKLQLKTITPVSIGADESNNLSPRADYVISDDELFLIYLENRKVERAVLEAGLLDKYVFKIAERKETFNLKGFLRNEVKADIKTLAKYYVPNMGLTPNNNLPISAIIKENGKPYIPGSSIKGAFRTAILYDWYVNSPTGNQEVLSHAATFERWHDAKAALREEKRKKGGGRYFRPSRHIKDRITGFEKPIFKEDKLFGRTTGDTGSDARKISITDSNFADEKSLRVYKAERIRLQPEGRFGKRASVIPTPREALFSDNPFSFTMSVNPTFFNKELNYLADLSTDEMLQRLSRFSIDAIDNEIYELENAYYPQARKQIDSLDKFYRNLQSKAATGQVFFRIGFGKTVYDNSLALAFLKNEYPKKKNGDVFLDYLNLMLGAGKSLQNYPVTRTVTADGLPLGWVEITKSDRV